MFHFLGELPVLVLAHLLLAPFNDTSQTIHLLLKKSDKQFTTYNK